MPTLDVETMRELAALRTTLEAASDFP